MPRHRSTRFAPVLVPLYEATAESGRKWSTAAQNLALWSCVRWSWISTQVSMRACAEPICQFHQLPYGTVAGRYTSASRCSRPVMIAVSRTVSPVSPVPGWQKAWAMTFSLV